MDELEYNPEAIIEEMRREYFKSLEEEEILDRQEETESFLAFRLGEEKFAIPITDLKSVIAVPHITKIPLSPPHLLGIINLRGEILPLLDFHQPFQIPALGGEKEKRILIVSEKIRPLAFLVDEVMEIHEVPLQEIQPPLQVQSKIDPEFLKGKFTSQDSLIILLNLEKLLHSPKLQFTH